MQQHILSLQAYSKSTSHTNQILSLPHHSQIGIYSNVPHATVAFWVGLHGMSGKMALNSYCSAVTLQKKTWNRQHFSQHGPYDVHPNSLNCIWLGHCHNKADWERGICCLLPPDLQHYGINFQNVNAIWHNWKIYWQETQYRWSPDDW